MFENLSSNFSKIFDKLTKKGFLTENDIDSAMREVRIALLEADVSINVIKDLIAKIKESIVGHEIVKSISPGQMVIKLVQDHLTEMLGSESNLINLNAPSPIVIMMLGLQGSGKTTSSAKLAAYLKNKYNKKVLLSSLDLARPAAQKQLEVLADSINVRSTPIISELTPIEITKRALDQSKFEGYDILILDTAGRLHIDDELMKELALIKQIASPVESLLVVDAMTGQDAVNIAKNFHDRIGITGVILTRIDGDSRGGAALSIKSVTNQPIKYLGTGEKVSDFEEFHPDRISSRILGKGDIVSLVERAVSSVNQEEAEMMAKKFQKGKFDLDDLASQFKNIRKIGGMSSIMSMIPGISKLKDKIDQNMIDEKLILKKEAILSSMTKFGRKNPSIIAASRKRRIAKGAGVLVQDVNRLLKEYQNMSSMVKKMGKLDKSSLLKSGINKLFS